MGFVFGVPNGVAFVARNALDHITRISDGDGAASVADMTTLARTERRDDGDCADDEDNRPHQAVNSLLNYGDHASFPVFHAEGFGVACCSVNIRST